MKKALISLIVVSLSLPLLLQDAAAQLHPARQSAKHKKLRKSGKSGKSSRSVRLAKLDTSISSDDSKRTRIAQTGAGSSSMRLEDIRPRRRKAVSTDDPDADEVITNRKLRAETGAKKMFSFSTSLEYKGGSIEKPFAAERPNIKGAVGEPTDVSLNGSLGIKFRLSNLQSLNFGVGVGVAKPFHSDEEKSFNDRSYIDDPGLSYQLLSKFWGIQSVSSLGASAYTSDFLRKLGYAWGVSASEILIYDFGGSAFSVGSSFVVSRNFFDSDKLEALSNQSDYGFGVYPFMEYVINDTFNLRTLSGVWVYEHTRETYDYWTFHKNKIYQSFGLGISVTRDLYLYPNVQFLPEDPGSDKTNVALAITLNL
jgi:hypothetical protein